MLLSSYTVVGYLVPIVWKSLQSFKMPGTLYPTTQCNIPEDMDLYVNLVSSTLLPFMFKLFEEKLLHITKRITVNLHCSLRQTYNTNYLHRMTVFSSGRLPITICKVDDADYLYKTLLGTRLLGVPRGGSSRLAKWPMLTAHSEIFELRGTGWKKSCGDIILSSSG